MRYMIVYQDFGAAFSFSVLLLALLLFFSWSAYKHDEQESARLFFVSALLCAVLVLVNAGNYSHSLLVIRIKCPDMELTEAVLKNCKRVDESRTP